MLPLTNLVYLSYGNVIVGVPETPCCVILATIMTPSFAPVAVTVNDVAVTVDMIMLPLALDESDQNVVTSDTPTNVLFPPPNAAGLRQ